jgi:deazaflavin-dependent oxidoreductase (nitroreductase family)
MRFKVEGPFGRAVQKISSSPRFAPVASRVLPPIDRTLTKLTRGRFVLTSLLMPSLVLTHTGAKTGLQRVTPLACMPDGDGAWYVVASNFGQKQHPLWSGNLIKTPAARVTYEGKTYDVTAQLLNAQEKAEAWQRLTKVWPAYDAYYELSGGRDIRVFRLVATSP